MRPDGPFDLKKLLASGEEVNMFHLWLLLAIQFCILALGLKYPVHRQMLVSGATSLENCEKMASDTVLSWTMA